MKLFKNKQKSDEDIIDKIEDLEVKIDELKTKIESSNSNREKTLEDMAFNAKHERIKQYEDRIKQIKNESSCRKLIIEQKQEKNEKLKTTNQNLCGKAGGATKENNRLKKENEELKKELQDLKDKGMVLPKRVRKTGVTKDTKQTIGIKNSKVSSATKKELKKINELREKEAV